MTRPSLGQAGWLALGAAMAGLLAVTALGAGAPGLRHVDAPTVAPGYAVPDPAPLRTQVRQPALLVVADGVAGGLAPRLARLPGVADAERLGIASLTLMGRTVTAATVDPASYRRLSPETTARSEPVWDAVARGDAAVSHGVVDGLRLELGATVPVTGFPAGVRLGAVASTVPGIDVVVNRARGAALGLPAGNGALVTLARTAEIGEVRRSVARHVGRDVAVSVLAARPGRGQLAARLVGGAVADAVGSFSYRWFADGSVRPDPAWIAAHLVTGDVPILGTVTCHRVMLPQLRGALQELQTRGLSGTVDPADFGGCYAPRFIDRDPGRGLSLHTWGIAVDLNVSGNQVGTGGSIDPRVVEIFERWGFAWGGRWRVPDPMHFELATLESFPGWMGLQVG